MTAYIYAGILAFVVATSFLAGWKTNGWRHDAEYLARMEGGRIALEKTADELAKLKVTNTTIKQEVQTHVIEKPVYRDCVHDDTTFRLLNDAITGKRTEGVGDSKLPENTAFDWKNFWRNDPEAGGSR